VSFNSNGTGGQSSITWTGTPPGLSGVVLPGSVSVTFVISDVLAEVGAGKIKAAVSPKHIESFVELNGWKLEDPANYLSLGFGVITGNATGAFAQKVTVSTGSGANQVYAHFASKVDVNGQVGAVKINKTAVGVAEAAVFFGDIGVVSAAAAVYQGQIGAYSVEVDFPAGQTHIIYDPGMGAGTPAAAVENTATTGNTGSAETIFFSVIVMFFAMLF